MVGQGHATIGRQRHHRQRPAARRPDQRIALPGDADDLQRGRVADGQPVARVDPAGQGQRAIRSHPVAEQTLVARGQHQKRALPAQRDPGQRRDPACGQKVAAARPRHQRQPVVRGVFPDCQAAVLPGGQNHEAARPEGDGLDGQCRPGDKRAAGLAQAARRGDQPGRIQREQINPCAELTHRQKGRGAIDHGIVQLARRIEPG